MEKFINSNEELFPRYAFVPGSKSRAETIASRMQDSRLISHMKGFAVYSGLVGGIPMLVVGTGMGGPTTAVCIEELGRLGVDTFIRIGSCGTASPVVNCGDILIATGAYRGTGTSIAYLPIEFPAIADFELTNTMASVAQEIGAKFHVGLGSGEDAFYRKDRDFRERLAKAGVISADMESDTLFIIASVRGWRAGALFASDGTAKERKPAWGEEAFRIGVENEIRIAMETMRRVALIDREQSSN